MKREYGISLIDMEEVKDVDVVILAVAHEEFAQMDELELTKFFKKNGKKILADLKGIFDKNKSKDLGYIYWRL